MIPLNDGGSSNRREVDSLASQGELSEGVWRAGSRFRKWMGWKSLESRLKGTKFGRNCR